MHFISLSLSACLKLKASLKKNLISIYISICYLTDEYTLWAYLSDIIAMSR